MNDCICWLNRKQHVNSIQTRTEMALPAVSMENLGCFCVTNPTTASTWLVAVGSSRALFRPQDVSSVKRSLEQLSTQNEQLTKTLASKNKFLEALRDGPRHGTRVPKTAMLVPRGLAKGENVLVVVGIPKLHRCCSGSGRKVRFYMCVECVLLL